MKISVKNQIYNKIIEHPPRWAFSVFDFIKDFNRREIDESFSYLAEEEKIRRIFRGIYDYPYKLFRSSIPPDINQVANALARKYNWKIYSYGEITLNDLKLSSLIHVRNDIFLTDGPSKQYYFYNTRVEFKHIPKKETVLKYKQTVLVIQAIKAIGKNQITPEFLKKLKEKFSITEWASIKADASKTTGWVYKIICDICDG